jgi:hypothetical protein
MNNMFSILDVIPNPFPIISKSIEQKHTYFKKIGPCGMWL